MMQPAQANAWATRTGYIPVSRAGIAAARGERATTATHPNDRVALDQLAVAAPWPWSPTSSASSARRCSRASRRPSSRGATRAPCSTRRGASRSSHEAAPPAPPVPDARADGARALRLFFLYPLALAVEEQLLRVGPPHPARVRSGSRNYAALARERRARRHRRAHARLQRHRRRALGRRSASRSRWPSIARARVYAFVRGAVFSAYVVSWVAVALLWMWILDADARPPRLDPARARHLPTLTGSAIPTSRSSRSRSSASGRSPATRW